MTQAIASRYAKALFEVDAPKGVLEKRLEDFDLLLKFLKQDPHLAHLFTAPHITVDEKKGILKTLGFDPVFLKFLSFLIERGRWEFLPQIAKHYRLKVDQQLGIWEAKLVSAVPIDQELEERLKSNLQKKFHKQIRLDKAIDPKLIGGARLMLDNEMIDWSLAGKLNKLKKELQK